MNVTTLIGNLTRDVEMKYLPSGTACSEFGIAINSKRGEEDRVDYFDVVTFGKLAEVCGQYLAKGLKVGIEGRLQQDRWEKEGQKFSRVKVVANRVEFLTPRDGNGSSGQAPTPASADDDIPF